MRILIVNGPNLNRLGHRQPEIYGTKTYEDLRTTVTSVATSLNLDVDMRQSNHEGVLIDWLHEAEQEGFSAVLLNAGAFTHYSFALYDAILSISLPVVEIHLTALKDREEDFRHRSVLRTACEKVFEGKGFDSYVEALEYVKKEWLP